MLLIWINLLTFIVTMLMFFAYHEMRAMLVYMFGVNSLFSSPLWFVAEGAMVGLIIGYFATMFGGEGADVVGK